MTLVCCGPLEGVRGVTARESERKRGKKPEVYWTNFHKADQSRGCRAKRSHDELQD